MHCMLRQAAEKWETSVLFADLVVVIIVSIAIWAGSWFCCIQPKRKQGWKLQPLACGLLCVLCFLVVCGVRAQLSEIAPRAAGVDAGVSRAYHSFFIRSTHFGSGQREVAVPLLPLPWRCLLQRLIQSASDLNVATWVSMMHTAQCCAAAISSAHPLVSLPSRHPIKDGVCSTIYCSMQILLQLCLQAFHLYSCKTL